VGLKKERAMRTRRVYWGERCNDAARSMRYRCLVYDGGMET